MTSEYEVLVCDVFRFLPLENIAVIRRYRVIFSKPLPFLERVCTLGKIQLIYQDSIFRSISCIGDKNIIESFFYENLSFVVGHNRIKYLW